MYFSNIIQQKTFTNIIRQKTFTIYNITRLANSINLESIPLEEGNQVVRALI